jgi:hypothetical protein
VLDGKRRKRVRMVRPGNKGAFARHNVQPAAITTGFRTVFSPSWRAIIAPQSSCNAAATTPAVNPLETAAIG